ncbi:unnamed protein product [Zymoseptoria tritici ST99CH_1A5]|uniref:Cyclin-like domain-containing protein n=1 Tax=Zymoseptoria tritici ST99CH_1A5 TaxID=1276529 RepID=A0A1Y6LBS2_ZYMTR|nr:unnamed protein product [Zymoseptoria tritici ST99CH_1A5]
MPPPSNIQHLPATHPATRQRPKSPERVLAEAEAQWLFNEEELANTPSIQDGLSLAEERSLRAKGVNFIVQCGIMLKLPQLTLSTAAVFFQRFLMRGSLKRPRGDIPKLHHYTAAATCLFLATKVEESCRKMKEMVLAFCRTAQKNPNLVIDEQSKDFWRWRDSVMNEEDVLLEALCFDLTVESPHRALFEMLKTYGVEHNKRLRNAAWGFVTDSNNTQLCLLCNSRTIAVAALYAACRYVDVSIPDDKAGRPWWERQHVSLKDVRQAVEYMLANYDSTANKINGITASGGSEGNGSVYAALATPRAEGAEGWDRVRSASPFVPPVGSERRLSNTSSVGTKRGRDERDVGTNGDGEAGQENGDSKRSRRRSPREVEAAMEANGVGTVQGEEKASVESGNAKAEGEVPGVGNGESRKPDAALAPDPEGSEEGTTPLLGQPGFIHFVTSRITSSPLPFPPTGSHIVFRTTSMDDDISPPASPVLESRPHPQPSLTWSTQLALTPSSLTPPLPGDKILLPPSALEALLSAASNLSADIVRRDLPAFDPYNSSSYSTYRAAEAQFQDQKQSLPYPLTFRLVNPGNGRVVYAGIREFSAEDGQVGLSSFLRGALGVEDDNAEKVVVDGEEKEERGPMITIHAKQLPKGTFVKLRPLEPGYDPDDWKALLEQHLRQNYTTLTNGEVLVVPGGRASNGKKEEFRFLIDGFKPEGADAVCVVDTDLEVDIEALNEDQARETMKRIAAKMTKMPGSEEGSSAGGEMDLFKAQEGQVLPGEYVDYQLPSWNRTQPLEIELEAEDGVEDVNLLISPFSPTQQSKPRIDGYVFAELEGRPTKRIRLDPSNVELETAEALNIAVYGFAPEETQTNGHAANGTTHVPRHFTLRARHPDPKEPSLITPQTSDIPPNEGDVRCKNCTQWVPSRTLMLHENFCLRNNLLCPKGCGQVFQKRSPEFTSHWHCPHDSSYGNTPTSHLQHDTFFHPSSVLRCPDCSTSETFSTLPTLAHHRTSTCPGKSILCRFCHLVVPQEGDPDVPNAEALLSDMTPHELADGARTTECHLCNKIVRLRDMDIHLKNHDLDRYSRPPPIVCRNVNCGRTLDTCSHSGDTRAGTKMGQGPGNDVGLCSVCFGPLYVSMYDPENKALKRRVERRYLQQLGTGCGKTWCNNEFCKTGRTSKGIGAAVSTKDAIPMVKPFLDGLLQPAGQGQTGLHFCVNEQSQKRRGMAELLAAEDGGPMGKGGFSLEWCVGALEAEKGHLGEARGWLRNWAVERGEGRRG